MTQTVEATPYVCVLAQFYQPTSASRTVEPQPSAYPYPNCRILAQCYRPNSASRIVDEGGRIARIVNNYSKISFNFGPTLLSWLESADPQLYQAIIDADAASMGRYSGHGSALAQAYNHMIMPLATERDKVTQTRWGLRDFERRFGRRAEGMWLPETAVDLATLRVLAEHGVKFTILAPHQARRFRALGEAQWHDVSGSRIDPGRAYRVQLDKQLHIDVFFYDGPISRAVAFEKLLSDGTAFAGRLLSRTDRFPELLLHIATDGETYGHHHRHGDMALTYALSHLEENGLAQLTNYSEYLEIHPPEHEVEIIENTSWSCCHGIERWRSDCGCNSGGNPEWTQSWRGPLRDALDELRTILVTEFEKHAGALLTDPWEARNAYVDVISDRQRSTIDAFLAEQAKRELTRAEQQTALELLESQRHAMLMYTSCGWFFDDISGVEGVQILQYAARAIELVEHVTGKELEPQFLEALLCARSNLPKEADGHRIYLTRVAPARVDLRHVIAHHAVKSLFEPQESKKRVYCYWIEELDEQTATAGRAKLALGTARVTSEITLESTTMGFGAVHFGDHNLTGGVRAFDTKESYEQMIAEVCEPFTRADLVSVQRELDKHFHGLSFSLKSLFRSARDRIAARIVEQPLAEATSAYRRLYETNAPLMRYLASIGLPLPRQLRSAAQFVLNQRVQDALGQDEPDLDLARAAFDSAQRLGLKLDALGLSYALQQTMERLSDRVIAAPEGLDEIVFLERLAALTTAVELDVDLWRVQNQCYVLLDTALPAMKQRAANGEEKADRWVRTFVDLCRALKLRVTSSDDVADGR